MKNAFILFLTCLFTACLSAKLITPSQLDVARVASKFPGYTLEDLNKGKALFSSHCGQCHGLKNPAKRTEEQWRKIVPRMAAKVNKKEGNVLDANAETLILKYLVTMSGRK
jgi:cytochrome c2